MAKRKASDDILHATKRNRTNQPPQSLSTRPATNKNKISTEDSRFMTTEDQNYDLLSWVSQNVLLIGIPIPIGIPFQIRIPILERDIGYMIQPLSYSVYGIPYSLYYIGYIV